MISKTKILLFAAAALGTHSFAQINNSPTPFKNYYYDYKLANPAFTGTLGSHAITAVYAGVPGSPNRLAELFYGSYEQRLGSSGNTVGGIFLADELGPFTQLHFGGLYSRDFKFNERSGLRAGTQIFYQRRTLDYSKLQPLNPGDPLIGGNGYSRINRLSFDLGVAYYSRYATVGVSLKNILHHGETVFGSLIILREFKVKKKFKATPSIIYCSDGGEAQWAVNNTFEIAEWILFGAGYRFSEPGDLTINAGVNIKGWAQVVTHVYSSREQDYASFHNNPFFELLVRVRVPDTD